MIVDEAHERSLNIDFLLGYLSAHPPAPARPQARSSPRRRSTRERFAATSATRRWSRSRAAPTRRGPLPAARSPTIRSDSTATEIEGDRRRRRGAAARGAAATCSSSSRASARSATRPTRCAGGCGAGRRGPAALRAPVDRRAAAGLPAAHARPARRARHQRRRDLAHRAGHPLRRRPGHRADQPLQRAPEGPAAADRARSRRPRPTSARAAAGARRTASASACTPRRTSSERPRFTDPEILRTNLAAVILQMAAAGLGDVEDFPFLDPPDRRQVRDGVNLLHELGALEPGASAAPADAARAGGSPSCRSTRGCARMVLEAERLGCADEVIVIAAALSIQDPRERPADKRAQADQLHARFADEQLGLPRLPEPVAPPARAAARAVGQPVPQALPGRVPALPAHPRVAGPRRRSCARRPRTSASTLNRTPAEPQRRPRGAAVRACCRTSGCATPQRREYLGARGARFAIFPGSALARKPPAWVMVAELVETSRLWGRTAARIQPEWIEPLAEHLVRRTYERAALGRRARRGGRHGARDALRPADRRGPHRGLRARSTPARARELFIRRALVEGDWETRHAFFADNQQRLEEVEELEHRARRRDILRAPTRSLYDFYDGAHPGGRRLGRALRPLVARRAPARPGAAHLHARAAGATPRRPPSLDPRARPRAWRQGDLELPL